MRYLLVRDSLPLIAEHFEKNEAYRGNHLIEAPYEEWSPYDLWWAWGCIKRHGAKVELDITTIPEPPRPRHDRGIIFHHDFSLRTAIEENSLIRRIRKTIDIRWDSRSRLWNVRSGYVGHLHNLIDRFGFMPNEVAADVLKRVAKAPPRTMSLEDGFFVFSYASNMEITHTLRDLPGRIYNRETEQWRLPAQVGLSDRLAEICFEYDFEMTPDAEKMLTHLRREESETFRGSKAEVASLVVPRFSGTLLPYQKAGVVFILRTKKTLVADDPGTGKTIQSLAALECANAYPSVVVCPAVMKLVWRDEIARFLPHRSVQVISPNKKDIEPGHDLYVINYELLFPRTKPDEGTPKKRKRFASPIVNELRGLGLSSVVVDEIQYCKTQTALRTKAAKALAADVEYVIGLTGTPILNCPYELVGQLGVLGRMDDLGGWRAFTQRYCAPRKSYFGVDYRGSENLEELRYRLRSSFMIRREKLDVLKELPPLTDEVVHLEIEERDKYDEAEADIVNWVAGLAIQHPEFLASISNLSLEEKYNRTLMEFESAMFKAERGKHLVKIAALKKLAAELKMESVIAWANNFLESGKKLILFAHHHTVQDQLIAAFPDAAQILAGDFDARNEAMRKFQEDPFCQVAICSLKAASVGITLTAASDVAFVELGWTPSDHDQASARSWRFGQTEAVTAWYLIADKTIEDDIWHLLGDKKYVVESVMKYSLGEKIGERVLRRNAPLSPEVRAFASASASSAGPEEAAT